MTNMVEDKMVRFKNDGRLKLLIIVGTRPEVIRLSEVIKKCRRHFDCLLAHTGQNYDYTLNGIFFRDLSLDDPDVYLDAVGADLGETVGNIIAASYRLMVQVEPDALLILIGTVNTTGIIRRSKKRFSKDFPRTVSKPAWSYLYAIG